MYTFHIQCRTLCTCTFTHTHTHTHTHTCVCEEERRRAFNCLPEQSLVCWDQTELLDQKHPLLLLAVEHIGVHVVVEDTAHTEVDMQVEPVAGSHVLQGSNNHTN